MVIRIDTHIHIVGPVEHYPQVEHRTYTAAVAPLDALRTAGATRDIRRFVVVQPSFYGTDNTMLIESLEVLGGDGRGVAVIDPAHCSAEELDRLDGVGVRGLRINLYSQAGLAAGGGRSLEQIFGETAAVATSRGWHVQVIAPIATLNGAADVLAASPVDVVIDHYGLFGQSTTSDPLALGLFKLLERPHVWVKTSAPYRSGDNPLQIRPDRSWLSAILEVAWDRCVWGSDWPHAPSHEHQGAGRAPLENRQFVYGELVDEFIDAVGDPQLGEQILDANPSRLYGFN